MGQPGDEPFPWVAFAALFVAFAVGFLGGMWAMTLVLPS